LNSAEAARTLPLKRMSGRRGLCAVLLLHPHPTPALKDERLSSFFSRFWTVTPTAVLTIKADYSSALLAAHSKSADVRLVNHQFILIIQRSQL
jgi:hypothetical protein